MKRVLVVFIVLIFVVSSFAASSGAGAKQPDLAAMKKIQYFKLMAGEEQKILDAYIRCLNAVDSNAGLELCNTKRKEMAMQLRKAASPGKQAGMSMHPEIKRPEVKAPVKKQ